MTIASMEFSVFARLFEGHADLITVLAFDEGCVTVELDSKHYMWRITKGFTGFLVQYSEGSKWIDLGTMRRSEFSFFFVE